MSAKGLIIPEDPLTGIARFDEAITFDVMTRFSGRNMNRPAADHPYEITKKPSSDARTETLDTAEFEAWYSDLGEISQPSSFLDNPLLNIGIGLKGRSEELAQELEAAFKRWDLVSISCPGFGARNWAIVTLVCEPQAEEAAVRVSISAKEQRVVELEERRAIADEDVEALGAGGVFDAGEL